MLRRRLILLLVEHLQFVSGRCAVFARFSDLLALGRLVVIGLGVSFVSHLRPSVVVAPVKHREAVADASER